MQCEHCKSIKFIENPGIQPPILEKLKNKSNYNT